MSSQGVDIPSGFDDDLLDGEVALAYTKKHGFWVLQYLFSKSNIMWVIFTFGLALMYQAYLRRHETMILTNRRLIGSINPTLFTKDKIEIPLSAIDNILVDETFWGNLFGWVILRVETRGNQPHEQRMVNKESAQALKNALYTAKE